MEWTFFLYSKTISMKKRLTYLVILFFFTAASGFIILKYQRDRGKKESELFEIIPRKGNSAQSPEWILSKKMSVGLIQKIKNTLRHWRKIKFASKKKSFL